jgi:hypothetical protein
MSRKPANAPAGEIRAGATKPVTTPPKGVTDTVLSAIDLSQEPAALEGRTLRLRKLVVQRSRSLA